jgi:hypothetical protein
LRTASSKDAEGGIMNIYACTKGGGGWVEEEAAEEEEDHNVVFATAYLLTMSSVSILKHTRTICHVYILAGIFARGMVGM